MNKLTSDTSVNDILPYNLANDKTIYALADALSGELKSITENIDDILFYPNIKNLSEEVIDLLAEQFQVAFYDILGLDLDTKRTLVQNSIVWNKKKGTKGVMQEMLSVLVGDECIVEEWFEYGGEPYYFRLNIRDAIDSADKYNNLLRVIYELKNVRSHLEKISFKRDSEIVVYTGVVIKQKVKFTVDAVKPNHNINNGVYVGESMRSKKRFTVLQN